MTLTQRSDELAIPAPEFAIRARGLSKAYRLYNNNADLLREVLTGRSRHREHWALKDVSFDVRSKVRPGSHLKVHSAGERVAQRRRSALISDEL